jgi:hypothetical protein
MAIPRSSPYIWVTWITALLAGDRHCLWSAWYRAHFKDYERKPTGFDLAAWTATHAEMVRTRAQALRDAGCQVFVEGQNKFALKGRAATLGGVPDLVAVCGPVGGPGDLDGPAAAHTTREGGPPASRQAISGGGPPGADALVIDCKSGRQRNSDYFQVLTYMLVLPLTHPACRGRRVAGEIQYRDTSVRIEPEKLTDDLKRLIRAAIEQVAGDEEPPRVPSAGECRFCDLCLGDCPDRIEEEDDGAGNGRGAGTAGRSGKDSPPRVEHDLF